MRTYTPKPGEVDRQWHVIDATDVVLGRLASQVAVLLRGKHKATFAPHVDTGDFVVIVNADKVALTGNKREQKAAYRHSGYPGGLRSRTYVEMLDKHPAKAVEQAVRGMLPKNSLARQQASKPEGLRRCRAPPLGAAAAAVPDHPGRAVSAPSRTRTQKETEENRG
ncbi:hypothetical protein GCM10025868_33290 [Angustibacter aerolatus]|uniref:Large ribosomal subunit protein uL13 n=1 Tax=Angustibacter aerolatus TaxID=1162965 RepID=A0ABQ6JJL0_9ACTN|nr:hypothetical protein GCM10025868_33290 [Angustibacter aerolatus]